MGLIKVDREVVVVVFLFSLCKTPAKGEIITRPMSQHLSERLPKTLAEIAQEIPVRDIIRTKNRI